MKKIFKLRKGSIIILTLIFSFSSIFFPLHNYSFAKLDLSSEVGKGFSQGFKTFAIEQPGVIYAVNSEPNGRWCEFSQVLKTTNDGKNWLPLNNINLPGNYIESYCLAIEKAGVVYLLGESYGIYKTTNGGMNWFVTLGDPIALYYSIAIEQEGVVYVARDGGVYKTTNGGANWFNTGLDLECQSLAIEKPGVVYASAENGVYKTTNGGVNWNQMGEPIYLTNLVIEQPGILYALGSENDYKNVIYKTTNDGEKWFSTGFELNCISSLAVEKPGVIYTGTYNGVYKTTNSGINWFQTGFTGSGIDANCLVIEQEETIYCSSSIFGIYKTTNGGINWMQIGFPESEKLISQISGDDRYRTAVALSIRDYPDGADIVVLARGDDFADGLCGAPLAAKYNAPLLLTHPQVLVDETREEIKRLKAKEIIMLGSNDALSDKVLGDLIEIGIYPEKIHRIGGATRYETSAEIARWLNNPPNKSAFVVTGEDYPDAISTSSIASSYCMPILLVRGSRGEIPEAIKDVLREKEIKRTLIVGGSDVVSSSIVSWLDKNSYPSIRIDGETRYETNINLVSYCLNPNEDNPKLTMNPFNTYLAYGENFPDALAAGVMAAKSKSPLILTRDTFVPSSTKNFFLANRNVINMITIIGGNDVVSDTVKDEVLNLIKF